MKNATVIHILKGGLALCGRDGLPNTWPEGHVWVGFDRVYTECRGQEEKLCVGCLHAHDRDTGKVAR